MSRTIGEILRDLRKENSMTQEQVAESLNVSFQSISRWENGLSYPDITLIPIIARLFDVSTDTLFDMDTREREQSRERYERGYIEYRQHGNLTACRDTMKAAQREEYVNGQYATQIRSLCERVLEDCKKEPERLRAVLLLCRYHAQAGNRAKALQLVGGLADLEHCRDVLLGEILTGDEKRHQLQQNMLKAIDYVATTLVGMVFRKDYGMVSELPVAERIAYVQAANDLYALFLHDGNYQFFHRIVGWNHRRLAELYLLSGDIDIAFGELTKAEQHATAYDTLTDHRYTALFVNTLTYDPAEYFKCWEGSERGMLLYRLTELEAYFVGHDGFSAMKARLTDATKHEPAVHIE